MGLRRGMLFHSSRLYYVREVLLSKPAWKMTKAVVENLPSEVSLTSQRLFDDPLLNKSSAFPEEERRELGLMGRGIAIACDGAWRYDRFCLLIKRNKL